jgi:hypothetical protein
MSKSIETKGNNWLIKTFQTNSIVSLAIFISGLITVLFAIESFSMDSVIFETMTLLHNINGIPLFFFIKWSFISIFNITNILIGVFALKNKDRRAIAIIGMVLHLLSASMQIFCIFNCAELLK